MRNAKTTQYGEHKYSNYSARKELSVSKKEVTEKGACIWTEIRTEDWKQWKYTDVVKLIA